MFNIDTDIDAKKSFGNKLREARKRKLTQIELAELIGVHENTIRRWETGTGGSPNVECIEKIISALNLPADYFIDKPIAPPITAVDNDQPQTVSGKDLDRLIRELASFNPDIVIRMRDASQNLDLISDSAKRSMAEGIYYVLGRAELDDLPSLKKDGGKGVL